MPDDTLRGGPPPAESRVTLVIPARNAAETIGSCLVQVQGLLGRSSLDEVIVVDDWSTDNTPAVAREFRVQLLQSEGRGRGAARNTGWRAARTELIWFLDADCVPRQDALEALVKRWRESGADGVGGSYENLWKDSTLAWLIQEEIAARHRRAPTEPWLIGTFNCLYRRRALHLLGGFDERYLRGQDAELSYRMRLAGARLAFAPGSIVGHHHPVRLARYLRAQASHGYWRVPLMARYRHLVRGDGYSTIVDHIQPVIAVAFLATCAATVARILGWETAAWLGVATVGCGLPMTWAIFRETRHPRALLFLPLAALRAIARGVGLVWGSVHYPRGLRHLRRQVESVTATEVP